MSVLDDYLVVEMEDGRRYAVPVRAIANHRAEFYRGAFADSLEESMSRDTEPLFASDDSEIMEWAAGDMDWNDVESGAIQVADAQRPPANKQDGWVNGPKLLMKAADVREQTVPWARAGPRAYRVDSDFTRPGHVIYPWTDMKPGDSFLIPGEDKAGLLELRRAIDVRGSRQGERYETRDVEHGRRVWRIS